MATVKDMINFATKLAKEKGEDYKVVFSVVGEQDITNTMILNEVEIDDSPRDIIDYIEGNCYYYIDFIEEVLADIESGKIKITKSEAV